jgi:hypothetical protein
MLENHDEVQNGQEQEQESNPSAEQELTDEQLLQMAEGSCSWGANCRG